MQLIQHLSKSGEIAEFISIDQFDGLSTGKCGYDSVAICVNAVAPGQPQTHTLEQVHTMAHEDYTHYAGPDTAANVNGMTQSVCNQVLKDHGFNYVNTSADWNIIRGWLKYGYPVLVCVPESSVTDHDPAVNANPYPWATSGINHIITATGLSSIPHCLKFRDSANITAPNNLRSQPRDYSISVAPYWAVVVVLPWLQVPPAGFDPTKESTPVATPADYDALYKKYVAVCNAYDKVVPEKNGLIGENQVLRAQLATAANNLQAAQQQLQAVQQQLAAGPGARVVDLQKRLQQIAQLATS